MSEIVSTRIPKRMARALREIEREEQADRSEVVRRLLAEAISRRRVESALKRYAQGQASLWKAARQAGLSLREMMQLAAERGLEFHYGERDLEADIAATS